MINDRTPGGDVWKSADLVATFLSGVRGGIPYAQDQLAAMMRVIRAASKAPTSVLDLGCGSGVLAATVIAEYPKARATLVDFSGPMLAAAREVFSEPPHRLVDVDFGDPGWIETISDRAPFDVVVSGYAIHHQPDERKRGLYAEIHQLLTPGGLFINVEHVASPSDWVAAINDELFVESLFEHHQRIGSGKSREEVAAEFVHRPDKSANILAPVEDQCGWLRDVGFEDVDCYFKVFELAVFGGRKKVG